MGGARRLFLLILTLFTSFPKRPAPLIPTKLDARKRKVHSTANHKIFAKRDNFRMESFYIAFTCEMHSNTRYSRCDRNKYENISMAVCFVRVREQIFFLLIHLSASSNWLPRISIVNHNTIDVTYLGHIQLSVYTNH